MRPLNLAQQQRMIHAASQDLPVRAPLEMAFCQTRIPVRFLMTTTRMMQTRNYDATLFIFNQDQVQGLALVALTAIMMAFFFWCAPSSSTRVAQTRIRNLHPCSRWPKLPAPPGSDLRESQGLSDSGYLCSVMILSGNVDSVIALYLGMTEFDECL